MNKDQFAGKWMQIRDQIRTKWGKLTDTELDQISGNVDMLIGKIKEKYGGTREEIERELDIMMGKNGPSGATGMAAGMREAPQKANPVSAGRSDRKSR
jgi:uncharacterized protein YjbJ (UPF0337 family)